MPVSTQVRDATADDAEAVATILNAFVTTAAVDWMDEARSIAEVRRWIDTHEVVLVAHEDDDIVGVAAFGWFADVVERPGYRFTVEHTVHVREDRWRRGIGHRLMDELIERARRATRHSMVGRIDGSNEASLRFHAQLGFVEVARMPELGAKFGQWRDLVLVQLRLDERSTPPPTS